MTTKTEPFDFLAWANECHGIALAVARACPSSQRRRRRWLDIHAKLACDLYARELTLHPDDSGEIIAGRAVRRANFLVKALAAFEEKVASGQ